MSLSEKILAKAYTHIGRFVALDITHVLTLGLSDANRVPTVSSQTVEPLNETNCSHYQSDTSFDLGEHFLTDLQAADSIGYGLFESNKLQGYCLVSKSPVAPKLNTGGNHFAGIGLTFPSNVRYLYKVYVHPSLRGSKRNAILLSGLVTHLEQDQVSTLVTTTDWTNKAFLTSVQKFGFVKRALAMELGIAGHRFFKLPSAITTDASNEQSNNHSTFENVIVMERPDAKNLR